MGEFVPEDVNNTLEEEDKAGGDEEERVEYFCRLRKVPTQVFACKSSEVHTSSRF